MEPDPNKEPGDRQSAELTPGQDILKGPIKRRLSPVLESMSPEKRREALVEVERVVEEVVEQYHSGPLPPAADLARYESVLPGLAERIVAMAEKEQRHRHGWEMGVIRHTAGESYLGLIVTLILGAAAIAASFYLAYMGKDWVAASLAAAFGVPSIVAGLAKARTLLRGAEKQGDEEKPEQRQMNRAQRRNHERITRQRD